MPSRTPSSSPEPHVKKRKHKHRSRSRSPSHSHGHKHHHKHSKKRHEHRSHDRDEDYRPDRRREQDYIQERLIKTEPEDRPIKRETRDDDYDRRTHRGSGNNHHQRRDRAHQDDRRRQDRKNRGASNPFRSDDFGPTTSHEAAAGSSEPAADKEKPNFGLSGKLTEETNTYRGVVIKYSEPAEARKPKRRWRLYPFKGEEALPVLHIHRQSAYLLGRDRKVADIPVDHPSCSKQHAVLQFRLVQFSRTDGTVGHRVRPYVIDLGSTNGTYLNNKRIEAERYVELMEKDMVKFGFSTREYVLLHDKVSTSDIEDDDVQESD